MNSTGSRGNSLLRDTQARKLGAQASQSILWIALATIQAQSILWIALAAMFAIPVYAQDEPAASEVSGESDFSKSEAGQALLKELQVRRAALEEFFAARAKLALTNNKLALLNQIQKQRKVEEDIVELQATLERQNMTFSQPKPPVNPLMRIIEFPNATSAVVEIKREGGSTAEQAVRIGSLLSYGADRWLVVDLSRSKGIEMLHPESNTRQVFVLTENS